MHLDVDKDVCLINITLSFFYQYLERKLPNANIVDILFSVLVFFFWFEIYKMLIRGSIGSKDISVTTT